MLNTLLIRADASPRIGTGHVMRCLALAQGWIARGGTVRFVSASITPALVQRLDDEGVPVTRIDASPGSSADATTTAAHRETHDGAWIVVDGYQFDSDYQSALKEAGARVLFLDDYGHCDTYTSDLILNQNIDADPDWYAVRSDSEATRLLMGPRFALLRKEFWPWHSPRRTPTERARRVLVTLGGGDPDNVTATVVRGIERLARERQVPPDLQVTLVLGGSSTHYDAICEAVQRANASIQADRKACRDSNDRNGVTAKDAPITLRHDVSEMAALMADHDLAVSAGGSTCWELAFMGLPNVIVILAENQRGIAEGLDEAGASVNLGWHADVTAHDVEEALHDVLSSDKKRIEMAQAAQHLVDGQGVRRVVDTIHTRCNANFDNDSNVMEARTGSSSEHKTAASDEDVQEGLKLRPVEESDCKRLWQWANDPEVRRQSYNTEEIPWEDHKEWFQRKRLSDDCTIYIAECEGDPVGQIRFDVEDERSVVDVHVDPDQHGKGFGTKIIKEGTGKFLDLSDLNQVHAYIKIDNIASCRAFEKAGYAYHGKSSMKGQESYCYIASSSD